MPHVSNLPAQLEAPHFGASAQTRLEDVKALSGMQSVFLCAVVGHGPLPLKASAGNQELQQLQHAHGFQLQAQVRARALARLRKKNALARAPRSSVRLQVRFFRITAVCLVDGYVVRNLLKLLCSVARGLGSFRVRKNQPGQLICQSLATQSTCQRAGFSPPTGWVD